MLKFIASYVLINWIVTAVWAFIKAWPKIDDECIKLHDADRDEFWENVTMAYIKISQVRKPWLWAISKPCRIIVIIFVPQILVATIITFWDDVMDIVKQYYSEKGLS